MTHQPIAKEKLSVLMRRHDDEIDRAKLERIKPISLDPSKYVPLLHAENGGRPPLIVENDTRSRFKKFTEVVKLSSRSWWGRGGVSAWLSGAIIGLYGFLWLDPFALIVGAILVSIGARLIKVGLYKKNHFKTKYLIG